MSTNKIYIPSGHLFCPYCGKTYNMENFAINPDEEFFMCNRCRLRKKNFKLIKIILGFILCPLITYITYSSSHSSQMDWEDLLFMALGGVMYSLPLYLLLCEGIKLIIGFTPIRTTLSKRRKTWIRQLSDKNGIGVHWHPEYTYLEKCYYNKTGVYRSRMIDWDTFICPCCNKHHPLNSGITMSGSDTSYLSNHRIEKKYLYLLCPTCAKLKKAENFLYLIGFVVSGFCIVKFNICSISFKFGDLLLLIFTLLFMMVVAYWILVGLYRLLFIVFGRKNLFIFYNKVAFNGAIPRYRYPD